ncbi:8-oxoguanine DNA glycosylase [Hydrogenimonas sp.]
MELLLKIEESDIQKVKSFYEKNEDNPFVRKRIDRNLNKQNTKISKEIFFKTMVSCLLTTQQRSGPDSAVTKFINTKPFPLQYNDCIKQRNLNKYILNILNSHIGLRRKNKIADEIVTNLRSLENDLWKNIFKLIENLHSNSSVINERKAARYISDNLKGFGPKQSRNLLQSLGLTIYEIPIDSRITKWLNEFGFPIKLSATALADHNYYNFVSDGFQKICKACDIKPCVMDAVIFSSFDKNWTIDNVVW